MLQRADQGAPLLRVPRLDLKYLEWFLRLFVSLASSAYQINYIRTLLTRTSHVRIGHPKRLIKLPRRLTGDTQEFLLLRKRSPQTPPGRERFCTMVLSASCTQRAPRWKAACAGVLTFSVAILITMVSLSSWNMGYLPQHLEGRQPARVTSGLYSNAKACMR